MSITPDPGSAQSAVAAREIAEATARLHAEHKQETGALQQAVDRLTALVGRPSFVAGLAFAILGWITANLLVGRLGYRPADLPPFAWLQGAITTAALFIAALILTTQRRQDQLADHRSQLILELTILNDQKSAKIIELLEEVRRDNPAIADRIDHQAVAMSKPSDTLAVLGAIKDVQENIT